MSMAFTNTRENGFETLIVNGLWSITVTRKEITPITIRDMP